jgi:CRP-like cAMP-binding protein
VVEALRLHLEAFADLTPEDHRLIAELAGRHVRVAPPRRDLVSEGQKPRGVICILDGWASVYKQLPSGRRQVTAFLIPGDLADANVFILSELAHSIGTITPVRYAEIAPADFEAMADASPRIAKALWWHSLVTASIAREWVLNVGQRTAYERLAHLICEMAVKLRVAGLADAEGYDWPLTQTDLADATGLTPVHVNRTLQQLRADGLIDLQRRRLVVPDLAALMRVGLFTPNYLHLERIPA